jgi:hypothetical protein
MKTILPHLELEFELQELYILSKHWIQDISFIEDEIRFFKTVFDKFPDPAFINEPNSVAWEFKRKIIQQEANIDSLKARIQDYLKFLEPFISDQQKLIDLELIEKFNALGTEIKNLFESVKQTKAELFTYAERFMTSEKPVQ